MEGSKAVRANSFDAATARARAKKYRRRILDMSQNVSALHIGGAYSCTEIVDCIYNEFMRPGNAGGKSPDTFLMSKGHGCMIQYVILEDHGILSKADLDAYCTPEGRLGTHPDYGNRRHRGVDRLARPRAFHGSRHGGCRDAAAAPTVSFTRC